MFDAALGRKQEAIEKAKRAVDMVPISRDAEKGPGLVTNLAIVYGGVGQCRAAFPVGSRRAPSTAIRIRS
jgi:hypothetical protein